METGEERDVPPQIQSDDSEYLVLKQKSLNKFLVLNFEIARQKQKFMSGIESSETATLVSKHVTTHHTDDITQQKNEENNKDVQVKDKRKKIICWKWTRRRILVAILIVLGMVVMGLILIFCLRFFLSVLFQHVEDC